MQIKVYTIDFELPRWLKKAVIFGGIPALLIGFGAVVYADAVAVPNTFTDGQTLSAATMNANFAALQNAINDPNPACPRGYTRDATVTAAISCKNGPDEVVKVGTGASAFWIDRYEASIWKTANGAAGSKVGDNDGDIGVAGLPKNGQFTATAGPVYALSVAGVTPTRYVTWFQAVEACAASGKRLPDGQEWLRAARGTSDGLGCNTSGTGPSTTGQGTGCQSAWGAQDMIGSLWEWTAEWYAGLGNGTPTGTWPDTTGGTYSGDGTSNIASSAYAGNVGVTPGVPAAALRGGSWISAVQAGVFSLGLDTAPSARASIIGFRCVLPSK